MQTEPVPLNVAHNGAGALKPEKNGVTVSRCGKSEHVVVTTTNIKKKRRCGVAIINWAGAKYMLPTCRCTIFKGKSEQVSTSYLGTSALALGRHKQAPSQLD